MWSFVHSSNCPCTTFLNVTQIRIRTDCDEISILSWKMLEMKDSVTPNKTHVLFIVLKSYKNMFIIFVIEKFSVIMNMLRGSLCLYWNQVSFKCTKSGRNPRCDRDQHQKHTKYTHQYSTLAQSIMSNKCWEIGWIKFV